MGAMRINKDSEMELVRRALHGDQRAYTAIYNQHFDVLKMQAKNIVQDEALAEDIVIDTFAKAFARLAEYRPNYRLVAWLGRINSNCAIDYYRKQSRVTIIRIDEKFDDTENSRPQIQVPDTGRTPEEELSYKQQVEQLRTVIRALPQTYGIVVQRKYFEGCTIDEIAEEIGKDPKDIRKMLHRAKREMLKFLSK